MLKNIDKNNMVENIKIFYHICLELKIILL